MNASKADSPKRLSKLIHKNNLVIESVTAYELVVMTHIETLTTLSHLRRIGGVSCSTVVMRLTGLDRQDKSSKHRHDSESGED